jgi:hypothetical protein
MPAQQKVSKKRLLLRAARSLGLGVPSLRDRSGRSAYGLLRCTSSRCVWLRQTVAALPRPDQSRNEAFRRRPWIKIKSRRAGTRPIEWLRAKRCSGWVLCWIRPSSERRPPSPLPREREPIVGLSKPEFDSVFHVGVHFPNTTVSSLSLRAVRRFGRARVRGCDLKCV